MKKRNFFGKKMTQFTRRHKYPVVAHKIIYCGTPMVIKEYHGYKRFVYLSNKDFTELRDYASPLTKREFMAFIHDYTMNPHCGITYWETETVY